MEQNEQNKRMTKEKKDAERYQKKNDIEKIRQE